MLLLHLYPPFDETGDGNHSGASDISFPISRCSHAIVAIVSSIVGTGYDNHSGAHYIISGI